MLATTTGRGGLVANLGIVPRAVVLIAVMAPPGVDPDLGWFTMWVERLSTVLILAGDPLWGHANYSRSSTEVIGWAEAIERVRCLLSLQCGEFPVQRHRTRVD